MSIISLTGRSISGACPSICEYLEESRAWGLHDLGPHSGPARARGARRRRCGDIVDDEQRSDRRATPMRLGRYATQIPTGSGGAGASAALAFLDDVPASPASRRLASAHAKPGTRPLLILGQAPDMERPVKLIIDTRVVLFVSG